MHSSTITNENEWTLSEVTQSNIISLLPNSFGGKSGEDLLETQKKAKGEMLNLLNSGITEGIKHLQKFESNDLTYEKLSQISAEIQNYYKQEQKRIKAANALMIAAKDYETFYHLGILLPKVTAIHNDAITSLSNQIIEVVGMEMNQFETSQGTAHPSKNQYSMMVKKKWTG